jgi:hypothetical protein
LAVLFAISVGLQVNDPDPIRWMAIYGAAGVTIGILPARRSLSLVAFAIGLFAAGWGAYLAQQVINVIHFSDLWLKMTEKGGAVEVGREAGGLTIVAIGLLACGAFRMTRA